MTGESESLRISFLEAVYGFRVSFLSLSIFLGYEFDFMAVSEQFVPYTKIIALKTLVKSMTDIVLILFEDFLPLSAFL